MIDPSILPTLPSVWKLTADHYAGVTEAARNNRQYPSFGTSDIAGSVQHRQPQYSNRIQVTPNLDLPQGSIFTLYGLIGGTNPKTGPNSTAAATNYAGEAVAVNPSLASVASYYSYGYAVNQESAIKSGTIGYATLLYPGVPIRVNSDSSTPPKAGRVCGITVGTLKIIGSAYRDLICLSCNTTSNYCDVVWTPWLRLWGQATAAISAATNPWTGAATGTFTQYIKDTTSATTPIKYVAGSVTNLAVVNRKNMAIPTGVEVEIQFVDGEWSIVWADC